MYKVNSKIPDEFICHEEIESTKGEALEKSKDREYMLSLIEKASKLKGLTHREAATLLMCEDKDIEEKLFATAMDIKTKVYGNRIVMFAPLYLSNYCTNSCRYCGYNCKNKQMGRKQLTQEEIIKEVTALQDLGHKRLALETGEDPKNCSIDYVLESIKTIYSIKHKNGAIRRVNVNIASTTVENYRKLKEAGIGTYILFQETYHRPTYEYMHPAGPKSSYDRQTTAMDKAMEGGIDDVGIGVLFGLYKDPIFEAIALIMHAEHLEATYGVGPHTISVPRIRKAQGMELSEYRGVDDEEFKKIVAIIRVAVPYTGMIVSTRETKEIRSELLRLGISQISGGSNTAVGGYAEKQEEDTHQFTVNDERSLDEIVGWLCEKGYIPSFCTACYREGRTGERFMSHAKTAQIGNICQANAIMTLKEYIEDYAGEATKAKALKVIERELLNIPNERVRQKTKSYVKEIELGSRDFRF